MKLGLIAFLTLFLCINAYSQQVSMGAKCGTIVNNAPLLVKDRFSNASGFNSFLSGIKITVDSGHFQGGAGLDYSRYEYQYFVRSKGAPGNFIVVASIPHIYPYIFINYRILLNKSQIIAGVNIGPSLLGNKLNVITSGNPSNSSWTITDHNSGGICIGLQMGCVLSLSKNWSLQTEAGIRYMRINSSITTFDPLGGHNELEEKTEAFIIPVTVGINYLISL